LINSRISWLVAGQSFLLGTYVFLINSPALHVNNRGSVFPLLSDLNGPTYDAAKMMHQIEQLRFWFTYTGILLAFVTTVAVIAGFLAMIKRNNAFMTGAYAYAGDDLRELIQPPLVGASRRILGMVTTIVGPLFICVWIGIICSSDILNTTSDNTKIRAAISSLILAVIWVISVKEIRPVQELSWFRRLLPYWNRLYYSKNHTLVIAGNGAIGSRIKKCLIGMGHKVIFYDERKRDEEEGCFLVDDKNNPTHVDDGSINNAVVLLILVQGDEEVKAVIKQCRTRLPKSCVIINHSTISISAAKKVRDMCLSYEFKYLEMPVSGGTPAADIGKLSAFYSAGENTQDIYRNVKKFVRCYCDTNKCIPFDNYIEPTKYKLVNQIGIAGALLGVIESLAAAKMMKLNLGKALSVLKSGAATSWSMEHHGYRIVHGKYTGSGLSVKNFLKDIRYVKEGIDCSCKLAGVNEIASLLQKRAELGRDESSMSTPSIYLELLERLEGRAGGVELSGSRSQPGVGAGSVN